MEEKEIAYITQLVIEALLKEQGATETGIPVGVSARHIHLTQEHVEKLFGTGYQLTRKKELMGGQYACDETLTIVSPKMKILEKVRILGPTRKSSQIELAATDATKLGIPAPLRESGDIRGSAPAILLGPKGTLNLPEGCIVAARHIHMSPADAQSYGVKDGDFISIRFDGERPTVFEAVKIRVDPSFTLEMHIDTDEANAAHIKTGDRVTVVK